MNKSSNIIGALANKGTATFRETFKHSSKNVPHYFPSHMAKGKREGRGEAMHPLILDKTD